jgi:hypothetical protein
MADGKYHRDLNTRFAIRTLQIIQTRTKGDPILCRVLAAMTGTATRDVTTIVEELRDAGEWICASQEKPYGYYYAKNRLELEEYLQKEHDRVMNQLARHKKQRDFCPPEKEIFEMEATI